MKIAKEIVATMIHHRLLPEFALASDNIEVNDALNIITAKLEPIREALKMASLSQGWDGNDPDEDRWTELYLRLEDALAMFEEE